MSDSVFLADVCTLITKGTTPTTVGSRFTDSGVNFIKSESLSYQGNIDKGKFAFIDAATHSMLKRSQIFQRDILYSIAGANLGKCGMATADMVPANTNQAVAIIRVDPCKASPEFVSYVLRDDSFVQRVLNGVAQSAQPNVNLGDIGRFRLPKLPLEVQVRIAALLKGLDDKIELNRRMNETLEAMAQAIFRDWFVDFGPTRRKLEGATDPLTIMGGLVQDAERAQGLADLFPAALGDDGLPEGWRLGTLGDLAVSAGATVDPTLISADTPYIGLEHMPRKSIALSEWASASKVSSTKAKFEAGQILFGKLRPYFHKVGIAPVNGVCSTDIIVIDGKDTEERPLLTAIASSEEFVKFTDQSSTGTKMPRTSWGHMKTYPLAIVSENVRREYGQITEPQLSKIIAGIHENRTLAATRDLLLPKLMSGEIRLSEAEDLMEAAQ